ncbi:nitroreductase/quinone reductase family protein [Kitasatospora sp. NPDC048538]|uniref:nitroreductase/quinone reductase family protein n=1 Tax=unclassified Kitasatospora TaxID=2633591 RepID=UPI0033C69780
MLLTTAGAVRGARTPCRSGTSRRRDCSRSPPRRPERTRPPWYRSLLAPPAARGELGADSFDAVAVPAERARRDRRFAAAVRKRPGYGDYRAVTQAGAGRRGPGTPRGARPGSGSGCAGTARPSAKG